jgi:phosphohistidine phosphatase
MKLLYLVRHAKSSWKEPGLSDYERPLARRGRRAARKLARYLAQQRFSPGLVLCSSTRRTQQTLELLRPVLKEDVEVQVEEGLYGASADVLMDRLHRLPETVGSVVLIGHNPGLQDLALQLARQGEGLPRLTDRFPTAALATLAIPDARWKSLRGGDAELAGLVLPRDLGC